ncbi:hypothetical protein B9Q03_08100 [Candidatus Marsarchaeota G2 archaeon OSP_D]|uniref:DUF1874 domain-containing protein n=1 Tax=Candidatus Marsarchaeota G2 archaeon OSP_D TaxID=1978157 RepID=A0A2R6ATW2_9ARCH|nr:MAG: hypothetical protein B9Q03_08100 [Candidatus Marsarchaeota G2 archaeon OSP_D]
MTMTVYLANAFSANMLSADADGDNYIRFTKLGEDEVKALLSSGFESTIGHPGTAQVLTEKLGLQVEANRKAVRLAEGDKLIVAQVEWPGGRLPEGRVLTKEEVEKLPIKYLLVEDVTLEVKRALESGVNLKR